MTLSIYAIPAMLAFLAKVGIFLYGGGSGVRNAHARLFLLFLASFMLLNVVEIAFFMQIAAADAAPPDSLGRLWFSVVILALALLLHFALLTALSDRNPARAFDSAQTLLLYAPAIVLQGLLWSGPSLISAFEPMAYTFTKVPGPLYFLWEAYVVGYLIAIAALLLFGALRQITPRVHLQSKLLLAGFVPLVTLALLIIGLQRYGFRGFNATATLPFASTFLLIVAAYATYRFRLPDVAFYIPWSKVRRRKTELYARLERMAAEIRELDSPWEILERLTEGLRCRVALLGGPQPWSAAPRNETPSGESSLLAEFPSEALEKIDRIVTADEIAQRDPELYALMIRYKVGAIVPFRTHRTIPGYCLLLGQQFNEEIYSSLDFKVVDRLFSAMAQRFFEDFLLVRSQLHQAQEKLHGAKRNLMRAEQGLAGIRLKLTVARKQNRGLREELARLRRANFRLIGPEGHPDEPQKSLDAYLTEREREALVAALERAHGKLPAAARLLGIPLHTLNRLIERYRIEPDGFRDS